MTYLNEVAEEIRQAIPQQALPEEDTSDLLTLYAVLLLAKQQNVTGEDVHDAWVAWMLSKGQQHDAMVPFL
jgi:hypothetical protein